MHVLRHGAWDRAGLLGEDGRDPVTPGGRLWHLQGRGERRLLSKKLSQGKQVVHETSQLGVQVPRQKLCTLAHKCSNHRTRDTQGCSTVHGNTHTQTLADTCL